MKPYKVISEDASHITYEYQTAYTWSLYGTLALMTIGILLRTNWLVSAATVATCLYVVLKAALGAEAMGRIRKAMKTGSVQISGSKTSFANPLRVRVPK